MVVLGVGAAIWNETLWPLAVPLAVIGSVVAYAASTGQTVRKLGPGGVELDRIELVREVRRAARRIEIKPEPVVVKLAIPEPTVSVGRSLETSWNVEAADSATGRDSAGVQKYEQQAMFAESTAQLADVLVDAVDAERARVAGEAARPPAEAEPDDDAAR